MVKGPQQLTRQTSTGKAENFPSCFKCNDPVYETEKEIFVGQIIHSRCKRCYSCGGLVNSGCLIEGNIYDDSNLFLAVLNEDFKKAKIFLGTFQ